MSDGMDTERERYLLANMRRWHRVADIEHAKHCKAHHDCRSAVERVYNELCEAEKDDK